MNNFFLWATVGSELLVQYRKENISFEEYEKHRLDVGPYITWYFKQVPYETDDSFLVLAWAASFYVDHACDGKDDCAVKKEWEQILKTNDKIGKSQVWEAHPTDEILSKTQKAVFFSVLQSMLMTKSPSERQLQDALKISNGQIKELAAKITKCEQKREDIVKQRKECESGKELLSSQIVILKSNENKDDTIVKELEKEVESFIESTQQLEDRFENCQKEKMRLEDSINSLEDAIVQMEKQSRSFAKIEMENKQLHDHYISKLRESSENLEMKENEKKTLQAQISVLQEAIIACKNQAEASASESEKESLQTDVVSFRLLLQQKEDRYQLLLDECEECRRSQLSTQKNLSSCLADSTQKDTSLKTAKDELLEREEKLTEVIGVLAATKMENVRLRQRLEDLEKMFVQKDVEIENNRAMELQFANSKRKMEEEIARLTLAVSTPIISPPPMPRIITSVVEDTRCNEDLRECNDLLRAQAKKLQSVLETDFRKQEERIQEQDEEIQKLKSVVLEYQIQMAEVVKYLKTKN